MNIEDTDVLSAERDADPVRFATQDPDDKFTPEYERVHSEYAARQQTRRAESQQSRRSTEPRAEPAEEVEEVEDRPRHHRDGPHGTPDETGSIASSSSSSSSSIRQEEMRGQARSRNMSTVSKTSTRMERDLMEYLDRHPTAIGRIQQHRLQHMQTVGSTKQPTEAGVELPDFGGGKPYPPPLPEREEYVVEFAYVSIAPTIMLETCV